VELLSLLPDRACGRAWKRSLGIPARSAPHAGCVTSHLFATGRPTSIGCGGPAPGTPELTRSEWFYIYRWGVDPVHISSQADENFYQEIGMLPVKVGRFRLVPHWRKDYEGEMRRTLEKA
jgi:hypothetical protein